MTRYKQRLIRLIAVSVAVIVVIGLALLATTSVPPRSNLISPSTFIPSITESDTSVTTLSEPPSSLQQTYGATVPSLSAAESYLNSAMLSSAGVSASTIVHEPSLTPDGLQLVQIRAEQGMIALIYNSSQLSPLSGYTTKVALIISIAQDGSSYRFPSQYIMEQAVTSYNHTVTVTGSVESITNPLYSEAVNETINGNLGVATPNQLNWWVYGVHFEIQGNLPTATLVEVADSIS